MIRTFLLFMLILLSTSSFSQLGLNVGLKAGVNFSNLNNATGINADRYTGYMFGGYIAPKPKKFFGFRSEIILSRQGYNYRTSMDTGKVVLDYLLLPQLITLNFSKRMQLHIGGQAAFLLNAGVDSTGDGSRGSLFNYLNQFDYGVVAGGEIAPIGGLFFGARINISLNNLSRNGSSPNYIPDLEARNNVVQTYIGWRF